MAIGWAEGSIAGISLELASGVPCKVLLVDAGVFQQTVAGLTRFAADGTPDTQILDVTGGRAFGVRVEAMEPDKLQSIIAAINAAIAGNTTFNVTVADHLTNINDECIPDFNAGWLKIETQRTHEDKVGGIDFRFITA